VKKDVRELLCQKQEGDPQQKRLFVLGLWRCLIFFKQPVKIAELFIGIEKTIGVKNACI
jgi:hypothetical protein